MGGRAGVRRPRIERERRTVKRIFCGVQSSVLNPNIQLRDLSTAEDALKREQGVMPHCQRHLRDGLLAALGPARRGLSIQPTEALREE